MNYLGHAVLSFGDADILAGNMIADHVKGKLALDTYPPAIKKGILLHRKIDEYADKHSATQRAKLLFSHDYRLYSGAIMDTLYDHFLANDPKFFPTPESLLLFTGQVYQQLGKNEIFFPEKFAGYFRFMKEQNWLYHYRSLKGMERSLSGLRRRASAMPAIDKAYETFVSHYYQLNQCYYELIDDLINFVKNETNN